MRGLRAWLLGVTTLLVLGGATLPWTLPPLVRWFAIRQVRAASGREASIERIDLDLWRFRVAAVGVRVEGRQPGEPTLTVDRIESRLRLADLLRGRVRLFLNSARIDGFRFRLVRRPDGTLDFDDVLARLSPPSGAARPGGEGWFDLNVDDLRVERGTIAFEDHAVTPPATFTVADLALTVTRLSTRPGEPPGEGELTATLNGQPLRITLAEADLAPVTVRGAVTLDGLSLEPVWSYVRAGTALRPAGGRLTLRLDLDHAAERGTRLHLDLAVAEPRLVRAGEAEAVVSAPSLTLLMRDLAGRSGSWRLGRLEVAVEPTIATSASPLTISPLRLVVEDLPFSPEAPGRVALAAGLPDGATLDVRGTATAAPVAAKVDLTLARLDAGLVRRFLSPDPAIAPTRGRLDARLALTYGDGALQASGEIGAAGLDLSRRGQATPFATHSRVQLQLDELSWTGGRLDARRLVLAGAPRIVDAGPSPPVVADMKSLRLEAENVSWPSDRPAFVRLAGTAADGGTLGVAGTFNPATLETRVGVESAGVNLAPFTAYVPADARVRPGRGWLSTDLRLAYTAPTLRVSGDLRVRDLTLLRRGQAEPFVSHPDLQVAIADLTLADGALSVGRLRLAGTPTIVDGSVSPPARATFSQLTMLAEGFTWPGPGPTRIRIDAAADGGRGTILGSVHPGTVVADVTARLAAIDLAPAGAYLPPGAGLALGARLDAALRLRHDPATGLRLDGDAALADLALRRRAAAGGAPGSLLVAAPRLALTMDDLGWHAGTLRAARLGLTGTPTLADGSGDPDRAVTLRGLRLQADGLRIPGDTPGRLVLAADLPEAGTLTVAGTVAPDGRGADLTLALQDAALGPWQGYLPVDGALAGRAAADLRLGLDVRGTTRVDARGTLRARDLRLGPADRPPLALAGLEAQGIAVEWPGEIRVARLVLAGLQGLVERERDGTLPLRRLLVPRRAAPAVADAGGPAAPASTGSAPAAPAATPPGARAAAPAASAPAPPATDAAGGAGPGAAPAAATPALSVRIDELAADDGALRFLDRSSEPFYSEEITGLTLRVQHFSTRPEPPADLQVQGVIGNTAALELTGQVSAFATPFVLDLKGELREFPLPRTNPMFRRLFAWFLKRGSLTTRVHYRIVGDQLDAQNRVQVRRLDVERDQAPADANRRLSLPLGLIVALATDSRGDIAFDLPVKGKLGSPELSLGGAIWAALKNVLANVVTGPFQAIGGLFGKGEDPEDLRVEPVRFPPGSAALDAEADRHVQKVADFLRASPNVALALRPVVSGADLLSLRTREVTARIQRVQREEALPTFEAAAARVHAEAFPGATPPASPDAVVDALRKREPRPEAAIRDLLARRVEATRQAFVERAGVAPDRLRPPETDAPAGSAPPPEIEGERGGVELTLAP